MAILTKQAILAADDLPRELVNVPEWGGDIFVRALTASERDAFENELTVRHGTKVEVTLIDARAKLCARTICDETGKRLFTDAEVLALGSKSAAVLTRIFEIAQRLAGLSPAEVEQLVKG